MFLFLFYLLEEIYYVYFKFCSVSFTIQPHLAWNIQLLSLLWSICVTHMRAHFLLRVSATQADNRAGEQSIVPAYTFLGTLTGQRVFSLSEGNKWILICIPQSSLWNYPIYQPPTLGSCCLSISSCSVPSTDLPRVMQRFWKRITSKASPVHSRILVNSSTPGCLSSSPTKSQLLCLSILSLAFQVYTLSSHFEVILSCEADKDFCLVGYHGISPIHLPPFLPSFFTITLSSAPKENTPTQRDTLG